MADDAAPDPILLAQYLGDHRWEGRNERGASVAVGPEGEEGVFSPGELLAIAVAACTGMSAERRITSELGDEVALAVGATRHKIEEENRYERIAVELVVAAAQMDPERRERMLRTARTAVAKLCTVSRSVEAGVEVDLTLEGEA